MLKGMLTLWTIMDRPSDFPDRIVIVLDIIASRRDAAEGTPVRHPGRWFARDLTEARRIIAANDPTADTCLTRSREDPACVVETWL